MFQYGACLAVDTETRGSTDIENKDRVLLES